MGANASAQVNATVNNSVTQISTSVVNSTTSNSAASAVVTNNINFTNGPGGVIDCSGAVTFSNDANVTISVVAQTISTQSAEITNQIMNSLKTLADNQAKQKNSGLNLGQFNASLQANINTSNIQNQIQNAVSQSLSSNVQAHGNVSNGITFVNYGTIKGATCTWNNTAVVSSLAQNISKSVQSVLANNPVVQSFVSDQSNGLTQSNVGLSLPNFAIALIVIGVVAVAGTALGVGLKYGYFDKRKRTNVNINASV